MDLQDSINFLIELIQIRSVSGNESVAVDFMASRLESAFGAVEQIPVGNNRVDIFCQIGNPHTVFTTHLDVVPAPDELFIAQQREGKIYGRGACDAKGCAVAMFQAAVELLRSGAKDFGVLFVIGEETTGDGAKAAAIHLQNRGIKYLVNGEPTENKLATGHKGGVAFTLETKGRACHSGYPHLGEDAIAKLIPVLNRLLEEDFGESPRLGKATLTIGKISGGTAGNVVPDSASAECTLRIVTSVTEVLTQLKRAIQGNARFDPFYRTEPTYCKLLDGFETATMAYGTDIPHFAPLGAEPLMYGPGSIHQAHTVNEFVSIESLERAILDYQRIFQTLRSWRP